MTTWSHGKAALIVANSVAAKGPYAAAVLTVLARDYSGLTIERVVGTSSGALAAGYAAGLQYLCQGKQVATHALSTACARRQPLHGSEAA